MKTKHNETSNVDEIPPQELDRCLGFFFISTTKERKTNGTIEYEPTSLKSIQQKKTRNKKKDDSPFYIQATTFQDDKYGSKLLWYKGQRLGTKSISKIIKSMATEELPNNDKRLTGHSARKGSIQKQNDAGVQNTEIVQRTGHKNVNSLLSYSKTSLEQQKKTSLMLSTTSNPINHPTISNCKTSTKPVETITQSQSTEIIRPITVISLSIMGILIFLTFILQ
ncbi:unnamed protein product [Mytilus coruscus]|uniref:DUF3504 domain-containing protein n=1 Tax=Mytilus coruscus TaxID=42192 RepID=A0A6J8CQ81_MYTCO|nr:unnamed protein product [Mytilus coruscus]